MADNPFNLDFKAFIKQHREGQAESNRRLDDIANSTIAGGISTKDRLAARRTLEAQEKTLEQQIFASGLSQQQIEKTDLLNMSIKEAEKLQAEQKAVLDELGIEARDNAAYRKTSMDLERARLAQAKASGSKVAEEEAKKNIRELRSQTLLVKEL